LKINDNSDAYPSTSIKKKSQINYFDLDWVDNVFVSIKLKADNILIVVKLMTIIIKLRKKKVWENNADVKEERI